MKTKKSDTKKESRKDINDVYPSNQCTSNSKPIDESFRIDDNSDYSTTAMAENKCLDDVMVPGVGVSETEPKD